MIGNPVSFPRVKALVDAYEVAGGEFGVVQVTEQAIMDATILANRHGHIVCTQGGECLAGLLQGPRRGQGGRRGKGSARFDGARAQVCGIPEYVFYRYVPAGIRRRARREPRQSAFAGGSMPPRRRGSPLRSLPGRRKAVAERLELAGK